MSYAAISKGGARDAAMSVNADLIARAKAELARDGWDVDRIGPISDALEECIVALAAADKTTAALREALPSAHALSVTIVMYHYVRDLERSRFPAIKARRTAEFDRQLDHIAATYQVVKAEQVIDAAGGRGFLPPRPLWLTFDDGFADHYQTVLPRLHARGWQGSFYVPAAVTTGVVLDVHKIHFVLASAPVDDVIEAIKSFLEEHQVGCDMLFDLCWQKFGSANSLDDAVVAFVKTMLQTVLPQPYRSELVARLFARYVTTDERAFASELYMTMEQMRMMVGLGHHFGNHGVSHEWLKPLSAVERKREVVGGLAFLSSLAARPPRFQWPTWGICYPSNEYDADLVRMVSDLGGIYGLTANVGVADLSRHSLLELPRLDTNDLPH